MDDASRQRAPVRAALGLWAICGAFLVASTFILVARDAASPGRLLFAWGVLLVTTSLAAVSALRSDVHRLRAGREALRRFGYGLAALTAALLIAFQI
ncbi:MAG: hypothetical protein KBD01_16965 [Acidobacteria bacterium]|nr:hypothetical protein [Acidobacteriota bacterium]